MKKTVLVVEDNELNMLLAVDLLEIAGFRVLQATNAEEAAACARRERPDLILMDLALPRVDGLTAVRRLKQDAELAAIPIVALTAYAMVGDEERAIAAGCSGYIAKPIDVNTFVTLVNGFIDTAGGEAS